MDLEAVEDIDFVFGLGVPAERFAKFVDCVRVGTDVVFFGLVLFEFEIEGAADGFDTDATGAGLLTAGELGRVSDCDGLVILLR